MRVTGDPSCQMEDSYLSAVRVPQGSLPMARPTEERYRPRIPLQGLFLQGST